MSYESILVANATEIEKADFYKKTYMHVAFAILAFIAVEAVLIRSIPADLIFKMLSGKFIWLFLLGCFWLGSVMADKLAFSASTNTQYLGLALYILLESVIFLPLIYIALSVGGGSVIQQAAIVTLFMFGGLTAVVFFTNKDFSFLRSALVIGGFVSLGLIVAGAIFGFDLGLWFSVGMVALASISILYQTSNIKYKYNTNQHVGAALQLFASVMLLFWYILRILMSRRN
jgi:FtsH-binding integral membrane protein